MFHANFLTGAAAETVKGPLLAAGILAAGNVRLDDDGDLPVVRRDCPFDRSSDLSKLVGVILEGGVACLNEIGGDYAVALWNPQRRELQLVRDPMAVEPVYYYRGNESIWFCSNLPVLLDAIGHSRRPDFGRIFSSLQGQSAYLDRTSFKNVLRLPGGYSLLYGGPAGCQCVVGKYFSLERTPRELSSTFGDDVEMFRGLFKSALTSRLRRSRSPAAELSGGLDSSAVVAGARAMCDRRVATYSMCFPQTPECDESHFVTDLSQSLGLESAFLDAGDFNAIDLFEQSVDSFGDFHYAGNIYVSIALRARMADDGRDLCLNGVDGDNVIRHGLCLIFELGAAGRWKDAIAAVESVKDIYLAFGPSPGSALFSSFLLPALDKLGRARDLVGLAKAVAAIGSYGGHTWWSLMRRSVLNRELFRSASVSPLETSASGNSTFGVFSQFGPEWFGDWIHDSDVIFDIQACKDLSIPAGNHEHEQMAELMSSGVNELFFELQKALSLTTGVESASPFMDLRIVRFAYNLPADSLLRDGQTRALLRAAFADIWPESLRLRRAKTSLAGSFLWWFDRIGLPRLRLAIADKTNLVARFMNTKQIISAISEYDSGSGNRRAIAGKLWGVLALAVWSERAGVRF